MYSGQNETHALRDFNESILRLLERVEYRLISGGEDLEDIYRLRYRSYLRAGMLTPNATTNVARQVGRPAQFLSLRSLLRWRAGEHGSASPPVPRTSLRAVARHLSGGAGSSDPWESFVDITRFAANTEKSPAPNALPFLTLRLAVVASCYFKQTAALVPVKLEHAAFYRRIFNVSQVGAPVIFPNLVVPIALFEAPAGENLIKTMIRFPFFCSTAVEQRLMFGRPSSIEAAPLTVLPTAKYVSEAA